MILIEILVNAYLHLDRYMYDEIKTDRGRDIWGKDVTEGRRSKRGREKASEREKRGGEEERRRGGRRMWG